MPNSNSSVLNLLLNRGEAKDAGVVSAPAFSITKVLGLSATVLTPLAALLVKAFSKVDFDHKDIVHLTLGVLALLALTASADVIGRSIASSAQTKSDAAGFGEIVAIDPPISGTLAASGKDPEVDVIACRANGSQFLVSQAGKPLQWVAQTKFTSSLKK
jgi:hypothetical protein